MRFNTTTMSQLYLFGTMYVPMNVFLCVFENLQVSNHYYSKVVYVCTCLCVCVRVPVCVCVGGGDYILQYKSMCVLAAVAFSCVFNVSA